MMALDNCKMTEMLQNVLGNKMDIIIDTLKQIQTTMDTKLDTIAKTLDKHKTNDSKEKEILTNQAKSATTAIESCAAVITDLKKEMKNEAENSKIMRNEIHAIKVENHAYKRRNTIKPLWFAKLNFFTQKYEQYTKNSIKGSFYEEWNETELFIPKKFRMNTENMSEEEKLNATKESFELMRKEKDKMNRTATQSQKQMKETDTWMQQYIQTREMPNVAQKLIEIWKTECAKRKSAIDRDWIDKELWLTALPTSDGDGDDDEDKMYDTHQNAPARRQIPPQVKRTNNQPNRPPQQTYANVVKQQPKYQHGQQQQRQQSSHQNEQQQQPSNHNEQQQQLRNNLQEQQQQPRIDHYTQQQQQPYNNNHNPQQQRARNNNRDQQQQQFNYYGQPNPIYKRGRQQVWYNSTGTRYQNNSTQNYTNQDLTNKLTEILALLNEPSRSGFDQYPPSNQRHRITRGNGNFLE